MTTSLLPIEGGNPTLSPFRFLTLSELEQRLPLKEDTLRNGFEVGMLALNGDYIEIGYPEWSDLKAIPNQPYYSPSEVEKDKPFILGIFKYPHAWLKTVSLKTKTQQTDNPKEKFEYKIGHSGVFTGIDIHGIPLFVLSRSERDNLWFIKLSDFLSSLKQQECVILDSLDILHWEKHNSPFQESFPILFEKISHWLIGKGLPDALVGLNSRTEEIVQARLSALPLSLNERINSRL